LVERCGLTPAAIYRFCIPRETLEQKGGRPSMNQDEWEQLSKRQQQLHPALEDYLMETPFGLMVNHPLVQRPSVDPDYAAQANWCYSQKLDAIAEAIEKRDWSSYIWLHERPYRLDAFIEIADALSPKDFWTRLSDVWTDSENIWQYIDDWRALWNEERPSKHHAMDASERKAFKRLSSEIVIYRGVREDHTVNGMSWTLDRDKAIWFAARNSGPHVLLTARAKKADAHALLLGRKENEIVIDQYEIIATEQVAPL
jgi:hypothetical protein